MTGTGFPPDIDPESGCRLPLPDREAMDETGKRLYDRHLDPEGRSLAGLWGPGGVRLNSPRLAELGGPVGRYLRWESGLSEPIRERAILVTARAHDSRFEWAAHEPEARRVGLSDAAIDVVKRRKPTDGLPEIEAVVIALGRGMFEDHRVDSETFDAAQRLFGARQLIDLIALMGQYAATAALLVAVDMQLKPGETHLLPVD